MDIRYNVYVDRKKALLEALERDACKASNKARFILENLQEKIDLRRKKNDEIVSMLSNAGYDVVDGDENYKYLVKMPMDSVSEENMAKLLSERDAKMTELELLKATTEKQLWINELTELEADFEKYVSERAKIDDDGNSKKGKKSKKASKPKKVKTKLKLKKKSSGSTSSSSVSSSSTA